MYTTDDFSCVYRKRYVLDYGKQHRIKSLFFMGQGSAVTAHRPTADIGKYGFSGKGHADFIF